MLLERSERLHTEWLQAISKVAIDAREQLPLREHLTLDACLLTREHGFALRQLIGSHCEISAVVLFRTQHEALLRATWTLYAASDKQILSLGAPQTPATLKRANGLPLTAKMLSAVEESNAPAPLLRGLREVRAVSWPGLNSYAHAGLLALGRARTGHRDAQMVQLIQVSNAHTYAANMLTVAVLGDESMQADINAIAVAHPDCLAPMGTR